MLEVALLSSRAAEAQDGREKKSWSCITDREISSFGSPAPPCQKALLCRAGEVAEDEEEEELELSPEKGNVAFASAHDGWAFRTGQFAELYAAKLGFKATALRRVLWGDYRIDPKTKHICCIKPAQAAKYKPLFVQVPPLSYCPYLVVQDRTLSCWAHCIGPPLGLLRVPWCTQHIL